MALRRSVVGLCFVAALSLCISAFAQAPAPTAAGQEVALLSEAGASPPPAQATEQPPPAQPAAEPPKQIAQLFDPTPAPGSAADLI
ncbi:MAG: hypothetical protein MUQ56_15045, partial [Thermoleophilia bacterium]|nr:hypothetical protein [Thermoleophilia bacterium]